MARPKPEDFIGWKSEDGKLEVVSVHEDLDGHAATFKVTCTECSKDPELFPEGYFISNKGNLLAGKKPCGCAFNPKWSQYQTLIRCNRAASLKKIKIHGFIGEYRGRYTKLDCECLESGHKWSPPVHSIVTKKSGCPECAGNARLTEQEALDRCRVLCESAGYTLIGFQGEFKNNKSVFEYSCPSHGKQKVSYKNFVQHGRRCGYCWREYQREIGEYGWYPARADEIDYLYVINFNDSYIKIGRSFDVERRWGQLEKISGCNDLKLMSLYSANHKEIYSLEQELHTELIERGFQFKHKTWKSWELFTVDCEYILNKLLGMSGVPKIEDREVLICTN